MKYIPDSWTVNQNNLKKLLSKEQTFDAGIQLLIKMHSMLHDKKICGNSNETIYDNLWNNLKGETCKIISKKETSIIWNIWHITRIEDIVSGIIIGNSDEVLNNEMLAQLNIKKDTENAMDYKEIETLNSKINISALNTVVISVCPQSRLLYGQTLHFLAFRLRKCGF